MRDLLDQVTQEVHGQDGASRVPAMKITRLETFPVQPRWLFLKIHTDSGLVGLG